MLARLEGRWILVSIVITVVCAIWADVLYIRAGLRFHFLDGVVGVALCWVFLGGVVVSAAERSPMEIAISYRIEDRRRI